MLLLIVVANIVSPYLLLGFSFTRKQDAKSGEYPEVA
jgi:hypothetical protein